MKLFLDEVISRLLCNAKHTFLRLQKVLDCSWEHSYKHRWKHSPYFVVLGSATWILDSSWFHTGTCQGKRQAPPSGSKIALNRKQKMHLKGVIACYEHKNKCQPRRQDNRVSNVLQCTSKGKWWHRQKDCGKMCGKGLWKIIYGSQHSYLFVTSFLLDVQGLRKHSGKASLWVGVLLCFTWHLLCHYQIQDTRPEQLSVGLSTQPFLWSVHGTALGTMCITGNISALRKKVCRNWKNLSTCVLWFAGKS